MVLELIPATSFAQRVDTVRIYSPLMKKDIPNLVILPEGYDKGAKYPVLYLLHGYSANYRTWLDEIRPDLPQLAGEYGMIIVCPNGENSWYFDSTVKKGSMFETYITKELVNYIDAHYRTLPTRDKRAITGFSMGGHGAMYLAIRHQDLFGACGATSGGVDIRPFPDEWEIKHWSSRATREDCTYVLPTYDPDSSTRPFCTVTNFLTRYQPTRHREAFSRLFTATDTSPILMVFGMP